MLQQTQRSESGAASHAPVGSKGSLAHSFLLDCFFNAVDTPKLEESSLKTTFEMAVMGAVIQNEIENVQGRALVRRFTDELTGQTTLECAAISAQQGDDVNADAQMEARTRGLFEDEDGKSV